MCRMGGLPIWFFSGYRKFIFYQLCKERLFSIDRMINLDYILLNGLVELSSVMTNL